MTADAAPPPDPEPVTDTSARPVPAPSRPGGGHLASRPAGIALLAVEGALFGVLIALGFGGAAAFAGPGAAVATGSLAVIVVGDVERRRGDRAIGLGMMGMGAAIAALGCAVWLKAQIAP